MTALGDQYQSMEDSDLDVQLQVMDRLIAKQEAARSKKNDLLNSIEKINQETSAGASRKMTGTPHKKEAS